jgi:hypothetical protein
MRLCKCSSGTHLHPVISGPLVAVQNGLDVLLMNVFIQ